jgi:UDP-N-acetyl-D-mannosaminuronic acid dehydrogenase
MCESLGVDVFKVRELVNTLPNDPSNPAANPVRNMHFAGAGVGGHCLPKDPWLLKYGVDTYGTFKVNPEVIIGSRKLNMWMPNHMIELLEGALQEKNKSIKNAKVAVLGLAFLENSDDTRNTPTKTVYEKLKAKDAKPIIHDPYVREFEYPFTKNLDEIIDDADAIILMVKHKDYLNLNLTDLKQKMKTPIFIDGRNAFDRKKVETAGFLYRGIGKPHQ